MESLSNIVEYIDKMKIKSTLFGGFDKESVFSVIQDISSMYQKHISDLQKENNRLSSELSKLSTEGVKSSADQRQYELSILAAEASKKETESLKIKLAEADDTIESAKEEILRLTRSLKDAEYRTEQAEEKVKELEEKYKGVSLENSVIRERFDTLDAAIKVVKESEERAVADARIKADSIIDDAKLEASKLVENSTKECDRLSREVAVLKSMKSDMERSVADISFKIKDLYLRTDELRKKYAGKYTQNDVASDNAKSYVPFNNNVKPEIKQYTVPVAETSAPVFTETTSVVEETVIPAVEETAAPVVAETETPSAQTSEEAEIQADEEASSNEPVFPGEVLTDDAVYVNESAFSAAIPEDAKTVCEASELLEAFETVCADNTTETACEEIADAAI